MGSGGVRSLLVIFNFLILFSKLKKKRNKKEKKKEKKKGKKKEKRKKSVLGGQRLPKSGGHPGGSGSWVYRGCWALWTVHSPSPVGSPISAGGCPLGLGSGWGWPRDVCGSREDDSGGFGVGVPKLPSRAREDTKKKERKTKSRATSAQKTHAKVLKNYY